MKIMKPIATKSESVPKDTNTFSSLWNIFIFVMRFTPFYLILYGDFEFQNLVNEKI